MPSQDLRYRFIFLYGISDNERYNTYGFRSEVGYRVLEPNRMARIKPQIVFTLQHRQQKDDEHTDRE